ncbi:unnamed protein product [Symbiodinium sp. CCMP2592]|nr:unnamed protein product [Symbiodinium sp. CCMP2592]
MVRKWRGLATFAAKDAATVQHESQGEAASTKTFLESDSEASGGHEGNHDELKQVQWEVDAMQSEVSDAETEADLQEIKAKTMYRMVENISLGSGSRHKVLYLTNKQARLLANTPGSIKRVLEAFEIPTPKLVIRFIQSMGGVDWTKTRTDAGIPLQSPFPGGEEEALQAEQGLYHFMEEVLLPLAAETSALILVQATLGSCMLTSALGQALKLHRNRFGKQLPFCVIALTADFRRLYSNDDPSAKWREFQRAVCGWRRRHRASLNQFFNKEYAGPRIAYDLLDDFAHYILCDGINEFDGTMDFTPFAAFNDSLLNHLMEQVPCIAVKAGHSTLEDSDEASLGNIVACLEGGCPTILVNLRPWPSGLQLSNLQESYEEFLHEIHDQWDYLDCNVICLIVQALENSDKALSQQAVEQPQTARKCRQTAV